MTTTTKPRLEFELADYIHRAMRHAEMSISDLADAIGADRNTVSRWLKGRTSPNARDQRAIERATGVPAGWLGKYTPRDSNPEPTD